LKPVADEAGRGYTCGTSRGAGATYSLNRAPAQPAPRSTCTASPYTPPPASRARRDGVGAGCGRAAGQVSWGRVGSVGRFDRLWYTDGRPFVRGAHQRHGAARAGSMPTLLECTRECNYEPGLIVERGGHSPTMRLIMSQNAHSWAHSSTMSPSALIVEL
jgi:hypothetical protein